MRLNLPDWCCFLSIPAASYASFSPTECSLLATVRMGFPKTVQFEFLIAAVGLLTVTGCTRLWFGRPFESGAPLESPGNRVAANSFPMSHATFDTAQVRADQTAAPPESSQEIEDLVRDVRQKIALTLAEEGELRTQLAACRPDERAAVAGRFRSTLAYRQEILSAGKLPGKPSQAENSVARDPSNTPPEGTQAARPVVATPFATAGPVQLVSHSQSIESMPEATPVPNRGSTLANQARATEALDAKAVSPASYAAPSQRNSSWQEHLALAVQQLEIEIPSEPGTTQEVTDHMRLSMLHLIAGDQEAALKPLPGASTAEQDYWSKQLFALATYLDTERQPDRKGRAAGTLLHLDQARSRLAEIASLQITNACFVNNVDGFGLYEPVEKTAFEPGQQVALYAQVENFRSESGKDGYRTSLATSYEVLDPQGRRVEGAQFPEIEDHCRNLRHDFHMQYGVILPTRIYPGEYELRLTITDQLSNKIAQTSIPFEIPE